MSKEGYNLTGWLDQDDEPYDITKPVKNDAVIRPVFEPITYTVSIDTDGDGDADIERTISYEDSINLPENNNSKPGHQPNGWIDSNGNHYDDGDDISSLITEDGGTVTISPDFTPNHYTVKLDTNGDGNADTNLEVTYGDEINLPENHASETGHHPNGWTDGNGNHYNDGDDISGLLLDDGGEIVLTPDFAPNVFTVGLDTDGDGDDDQTLTVTYGVEALLPETPAPETGSKKNGWIDELGNVFAEGDDISDLLLGNGESMSLKPNYVPIEYTIAIDTDGDGDADINETVSYGESFTLPTNTSTQPGYNPNGWLNGRTHYDNGESVQNLTATDGNTVEIVPDYTPRTISVCYTTVQDPTIVGEDKCETATFDRMYYMSDNYFTRTGYDPIDGWAYSDTGNIEYSANEEYNPNTDILACSDDANCKKTLYAMWEPHQTTISYAPGDGVTDATGTVANSTFTFDSEATFTNNTFSRPGYTQSGWKLNGTDYELGGTISKWTVDEPSQTAKATWTPEVYNISFNMNCRPNITGTGSMDNMTNITYDAGATLTSNSFSCGEGYSFAGWKRDNTGSLITNGGRADKFDVDANGDTVQLYAQWNIDDHFIAGMREAGKTKMTANDGKDYYKMQDMTSSLCSFVPTATTNDNNEEIQLVDTRDGKTYWVSKLKDGKCWMTQNLDLDLNTTKTLTPNDTNITANWTPSTNIIAANQIETWRVVNDRADSFNPGDWYYQEGSSAPTVHNYLTNGANANFSATPFAANGTHTHIGNFYNFQAFTAIHNSTSLQNGTSSTSICPKGWTLPSDFKGLLSAYGIISVSNEGAITTLNEKALTTKPLYFVRGGVILGTTDGVEPGQLGDPGVSFMYPTNIYNYTPKTILFQMEQIQDTVLRVYNPAALDNPTGNNIAQMRYGRGAGITVRCIAQ
ncbi:InlB B-repeat-containing protein [Candidatus Saccharibacteria bacterium]|nr:InlB B-repeat-containing protein [Candidatus Saccharibacteria bacterium]